MWWQRFRSLTRTRLLRRAPGDRDLDDEIGFHLAEDIKLRIERGASADDAERDARRAFGSVALTKENSRAVWVPTALEQLLQDLRLGLRIFTKSPALAATAVILVALVVGGNTTIFSIVHGVLTKPAPGVEAGRLVKLDLTINGRPYNGGNSYPNYFDYAAQSTTVRPLLVGKFKRFTVTTQNGSYALFADLVSTNYFETLGVHPMQGRTFTEEDVRAGLVAMISERVWRRQFESATNILGQSIIVNGHPATIVGVAPPRFQGAATGESADIWIPLLSYARIEETGLRDRSDMRASIIGQLAPGASLSEAQAEFAAISRRLQTAYPDTNKNQLAFPIPYSAIPTGGLLSRRGLRYLAIFQIVTILTVVIVCANVANLMLGRAVARQRELALRQSLGASRVRIVRMLLAEGLVVSLAAWIVAALFAISASKILAGLVPPDPSGATLSMDFTPDWQVAAYAMVLAMLGTVAFTIGPAVRAWRQPVLPLLKAGEHGVVQGRSRVSNLLVVVQLAFSVLLLTSAGLAYRSISLINGLDLGFNRNNLLLVTVNTAGSAATKETNLLLLDGLREGLRGVPGVASVSHVRLASGGGGDQIRLRGAEELVRGTINYVGPDYLRAFGIAPLLGRELTERDRTGAAKAAVINQYLAEALWPGQSALGQTILVGADRQAAEVVGVSPNAFFNGFRRDAHPNYVLLSEHQEPAAPGETTFYVRYGGSLDLVASAIGRALRDVDAQVPIASMRTMNGQTENSEWPVRFIVRLLMVFGVGSLAIAGIGQYAVIAFSMKRRTRDFGVRMALGASSQQILSSIVVEGLRLTAVGLVLGFALSVAAGKGLGGFLYGVTPTDSRTYLGVFSLLASSSLLACYLPARRASRIDPLQALRQE
jgi:putative ABC transport system permease protein